MTRTLRVQRARRGAGRRTCDGVVTDTVVVPEAAAARLPLTVVSIAPLLAECIRRLHDGESLNELLSWG